MSTFYPVNSLGHKVARPSDHGIVVIRQPPFGTIDYRRGHVMDLTAQIDVESGVQRNRFGGNRFLPLIVGRPQ